MRKLAKFNSTHNFNQLCLSAESPFVAQYTRKFAPQQEMILESKARKASDNYLSEGKLPDGKVNPIMLS